MTNMLAVWVLMKCPLDTIPLSILRYSIANTNRRDAWDLLVSHPYTREKSMVFTIKI